MQLRRLTEQLRDHVTVGLAHTAGEGSRFHYYLHSEQVNRSLLARKTQSFREVPTRIIRMELGERLLIKRGNIFSAGNDETNSTHPSVIFLGALL